MKHIICLVLISVGLFSSSAQATGTSQDLISAFPGSEISKEVIQNYNAIDVPLSPPMASGEIPTREMFGRITGRHYKTPKGTTDRQVYAGYMAAFEKQGATIRLDCNADTCGKDYVKRLVADTARHETYSEVDIYNLQNFYFVSADFPSIKGAPTVILLVAESAQSGQGTNIILEIVEPFELDKELIKVNPLYTPAKQPDPAGRKPEKADAPKTGDHPMLSRYPGTYIESQEKMEYTEFGLPVGPLDSAGVPQVKIIGGRAQFTNYVAPKDLSLIQLHRNYEQALQNAGFTVLYSCDKFTCGDRYVRKLLEERPYLSAVEIDIYNIANNPFQLLSADLYREGKPTIHVFMLMEKFNSGAETKISQVVIEAQEMRKDLVTVDLNYLTEAIKIYGKVALYGIQFDFDKADIRPESGPQLNLIAEYLKKNAQVELYVVGHTDNKGSYEHNQQLSGARARAVVAALTQQYGIAAARLLPVGVGPVSPVKANDTENSMQMNRRVELVLKAPLDL